MVRSLIICCVFIQFCHAIPEEFRRKGFVYLHEIDPSILVSLRYCTNENFVGKPVDGYKKSVVIITQQTALALKKVQEDLKKDGYCLVVYDAYRPQQAVNHFMRWSEDGKDTLKEQHYYPRVAKDKVFDEGYVAKRSGHSRGSTVDLTIIRDAHNVHAIIEQDRQLCDGCVIKFLDDGTVDMGSSFDLFDTTSHTHNNLIEEKFQSQRNYLKAKMEEHGFKNYTQEWWHYTLQNEPFPADKENSYFDFEIE
jgi:D-alanyl-D-alanine dipeptidase